MRNQYFFEGKSNLYILEGSGHQMASDNPTGLVKLLLDDLNGTHKHIFQPSFPKVAYLDGKGGLLPEDEHDETLFQDN